jgi:NAD(P)-dependent dehydrogenase (short-subunit alcohol dehydrogenase family)
MTRVALITGAARGIGLACAMAMSNAGWRVYGVDLHPPSTSSPFAGFAEADLAVEHGISVAVELLIHVEESVHALVNNAALQATKPLLETTPDDFDALMAVNVKAPLLLTRALFPLLARARGAVVNVSSVHALATSRDIGVYAASKAALLSLTRTMALEFGPHGVRANALLPGAVDTAMLRAGLERDHVGPGSVDSKLAEMSARHPLGRIGQIEDMAKAVLFLADPELSSFMTGQGLVVDGGCLARLSSE